MKSDSFYRKSFVILSGGVGGAKFSRGFARAFSNPELNIITNTADDTEFYGLHISPDLDTVMYTLAGLSGTKRGWGIRGDTFKFLAQIASYGEDTWFNLGDRDLATHVLRTKMLREGKSLTQITSYLSGKLGVKAKILPMTNERVATFIETDDRLISFQEYFVRYGTKVNIKRIMFKGIEKARCTREVAEAIANADLLVFAPSNPIVSILPILSLGGVKERIMDSPSPRVAVSPFINKQAISGPAKELMESQGLEGSSYGLAQFYLGLIDVLVIHFRDEEQREKIERTGIGVVTAQTLMKDLDASVKLAHKVCDVLSLRSGCVS